MHRSHEDLEILGVSMEKIYNLHKKHCGIGDAPKLIKYQLTIIVKLIKKKCFILNSVNWVHLGQLFLLHHELNYVY